MVDFLSSLGGVINDQFGIGENTSHSLDNKDGSFGKLGDYAKQLDRSAERYYMEDGFIRDIRPRSRSVLFQQPDIYVVVKKRMFSSLQDTVRLDLLEDKERILVAATKRLFQNKTRILAAYEKLTKIEQLTFESERFNTFLAPSLFNLIDGTSDLFGIFNLNSKTKAAIDKLRKVMAYAEPGQHSNWTTNSDTLSGNGLGEGPGTFELTNVAQVSTTVTTEWGGGSAKLTLEDPYNLLTITEKDIDQALADVTNPMQTGTFFAFIKNELETVINDLKAELAVERAARGASQITFKVSPGTILSKRVRAILDDEGREIRFESPSVFSAFVGPSALTVDDRFVRGNDTAGFVSENNQLTSSEKSKFAEIIINIFNLLAQHQTARREIKNKNQEINYARNRMRLFFNGKYVIQPMDVISIWMTTRTDEDARLPGGFQAQPTQTGFGGIAQKFDTIINNINNKLSSIKDEKFGRITFEDVERISTVGPDMPKWLWRQFKQDITGQPTGPCIFTGLVGKGGTGVSGGWSDGKWTINVQCEDNTGFFDKSQINFKPAADVFNSSIYDPLTPFDVSFDAATGVPITEVTAGDFPPLLPENEKLLQSGLLTFRTGANKGSAATKELYQEPTKEISFNNFRAVLHDPDGMVYRWKQGIQTLTFSSRSNTESSIDQERAVLLTNQPFAGQDIMNVISILITGQPYNYGTFLKAAIANGNAIGRRDDITNLPAAETYIQGLVNEIERNNAIWGNFIPHKKLTVNPALEKFIAEQRLDLVTQSTKLQAKLRERAKAEDELALLLGGFKPPEGIISRDDAGNPTTPDANNTVGPNEIGGARGALDQKITNLSNEIFINQQLFDSSISNQLSNNQDIGLTLIGNEINADPTLTNVDDAKSTTAQKQRDELQLRQKLFKFTSRRFWQVRANEDQNLFIVDDQYDKNLDIQAFERAIGSKIELFNSEYTTISDKLTSVRSLLGLECFANTQGHIEVRPPLYNRMPSSVFFKMFQDRDAKGIKVFPEFLESLYFNQIRGIFNQLEINEDEIRLRATALGAKNDSEIIKLITGGVSTGGSSFGDESFSFLTTEYGDGRIGPAVANYLTQTNPDFAESWKSQALEEIDSIENQISKATKIQKLFTPSVQATAVTQFNPSVNPNTQVDAVERIRDRLRIKTGREPKKITELFGNPKFQRQVNVAKNADVSRLDRINVLNQIANFVTERQNMLRTVVNAIRNLQEGVNINSPTDTGGDNIYQGGFKNITKGLGGQGTGNQAAQFPNLNRKTEIPQFLEHMIEYEDEDDIGPMSGKRFVLTADRIVSMTISENPPPYTMVSVKGLFGEGFTPPPSGLNLSSNGNAVTTAYAVDYDLWYQYGFRVSKTIEAPYLSNPDTQCAPYSVATLIQARENILQGSCEIAGYNEFYQPGDVVYIEDRNLLFYVNSVSHNFSYGKLSTTLQLTYGHSPGEYIPTMLDVVGKILYNSQGFSGSYRNERQQTLGSARSLGALAFVANFLPTDDGGLSRFPADTEPLELLLRGAYGDRNKNILSNALFSTSGSLNKVTFRRQKAIIKIVYYKTSNSKDSEMFALAEDVRSWLLFPEQNTPDGLNPIIDISKGGTAQQKTFGLNEDDVFIEEVDMTDPQAQTRRVIEPTDETTQPFKNTQSPSSAAFAVTRAVDVSDSDPDTFRNLLANTVLDIFIEYKPIRKPTTSLTDGLSEAGQEANAAIDAVQGNRSGSQTQTFNESGDPFEEGGILAPIDEET